MHQKNTETPSTTGHVLHMGRWYDLLGTIISFGRDRAVREQLIEIAAPQLGEKVLDVGCGTGALALALESRIGAGAVHGIDASAEMIDVARKKAAKGGSDVEFQVAVIEAIPFSDGTFDLVTSSLMLHHLPDDAKRAGLAEIRRVLKSDGRFVAVDFAALSHSALGHLLAILGHSYGERTLDRLTPMLKGAGFGSVASIPTSHTNFAFIRAE